MEFLIENSELHSLQNSKPVKIGITVRKCEKKRKINESKKYNSDLHSPQMSCFFGIVLTPLSELHSLKFGIALTENGVQMLYHKAIRCIIKSIVKVIKKSFFIKKENVDKKFALKKKKNELRRCETKSKY